MSGFRIYGLGICLALGIILLTSEILINFTNIGLGRDLLEHLPNLKQSLMEWDEIELSSEERTAATVDRSDSCLAELDMPGAHSSTPYSTMLNFFSGISLGCSGIDNNTDGCVKL